MGDVADDIISGFQCSWCGTMFDEEHGYPVLCSNCWFGASVAERAGLPKAINPEV